MIIEPMAGGKLEDKLKPVGRMYYAGSTGCVPTSPSQEVSAAPGAQAGEDKLREVITAGGFRSVRKAAETPFNMIPETRPQFVRLAQAPSRSAVMLGGCFIRWVKAPDNQRTLHPLAAPSP